METARKQLPPRAMAFYHQDGLPAAWQHAVRFAGNDGRLATMPDIVEARLNTKPGELPWETYFTTLSAEYYGLSRQGNRILIIAHGVGPLSTLDGIHKAYKWEYKDVSRDRRGGRISTDEFANLEAGKFGPVEIIDLEAYCRRYKYPFMKILQLSDAIIDPVVKARLGTLSDQYLRAHAEHARAWHREQAGFDPINKYAFELKAHLSYIDRRRKQHYRDGAEYSDPYILRLESASNYWYYCGGSSDEHLFREIENGCAVAHLISTGRLCNMHHEGNESLVNDVGCHEWSNGVRFAAVQVGQSFKDGIQDGPDAHSLLRKHWRELLEPVKKPGEAGFRALVQVGSQWFTQYPKVGACMDSWEPEHVVTSMKAVGEPVLFRTEIGGYHGFFKFGTNEVKAIAPSGVNAYFFVSEPEIEWHDGNPTHHTCMVQFYRITSDRSQRLMKADKLARNYEKMMKLLGKEAISV